MDDRGGADSGSATRFLAIRICASLFVSVTVFAALGLNTHEGLSSSVETTDKQLTEEQQALFAPEHIRLWWQPFVAGPHGGFSEGACVGSKGRHRTDAYDFTSGTDCGSSLNQLVSLRTVGLCNPCTILSKHAVLVVSVTFRVFPSGCDIAELGTVDFSSALHGTYRALHTTGSAGLIHDVYAGNPAQKTDWPFAYTLQEDGGCTGFSGQHVHQDGKNEALPGAGEGVYQPCFGPFFLISNVWNYINHWVHYWEYDRGINGLTNEGNQPGC